MEQIRLHSLPVCQLLLADPCPLYAIFGWRHLLGRVQVPEACLQLDRDISDSQELEVPAYFFLVAHRVSTISTLAWSAAEMVNGVAGRVEECL